MCVTRKVFPLLNLRNNKTEIIISCTIISIIKQTISWFLNGMNRGENSKIAFVMRMEYFRLEVTFKAVTIPSKTSTILRSLGYVDF